MCIRDRCQGKKLSIDNEDQNNAVLEELKKNPYIVSSLDEKDRIRKAPAPFTTSSMQQDAANKINFSTRKTMMVAQQLYEGIEIKGHGTIGLVSYIRTDSVRISDEAKAQAREYILEKMGEEYYSNNIYKNRKGDVQDAHEAIRPSHIELEPDEIKDSLSRDQYKLYKLIWNRDVYKRQGIFCIDGGASGCCKAGCRLEDRIEKKIGRAHV